MEPCARPGCGHDHAPMPGHWPVVDGFMVDKKCPCPGYLSPVVQAAMDRLRGYIKLDAYRDASPELWVHARALLAALEGS